MKLSNIPALRAFRSTNYTLYFSGRAFSQFGTAMQRTAVVWVVYAITNSEFYLGLTIFAEQFPSFVFSVLGGVYADRYNKYTIVKITQILGTLQAGLLALYIFWGYEAVWVILILSALLGIINAFDVPARQALIHDIVEDASDLQSAISLNSAMANTAKLLGPVLSGLLIHWTNAAICFFINSLSFGAVYISVLLMKVPEWQPPQIKRKAIEELKDGISYLKKSPKILLVILTVASMGLCLLPYISLIPVFAKEVFKGNAATYGYISGFIGFGAVSGTMLLASLDKKTSLRKFLLISSFILAVSLVFFSQITSFYIAMLFAIFLGLGQVAQFAVSMLIIQTETASEMRGRVISILLMAFYGMGPIGSLLVGSISEYIGAPNMLFIMGIIGIGLTFLFYYLLKKRKDI
ncbi:Predicted arabinose efflux permease, MFS family [Pustulibacterium marinum]|uniref:Predicted arabinose efflux permease, MFS family n=1 Tax=Pustulibacterium marinum TaxID=1224947 RepID=A0A1I7IT11_9FLAO|nr:MFS transporter [Pustulibacterium marinum]SFU76066.1 Predicted arabinose efflux permease, MFS family [Pustulibacterium marinum]